MNNPSDLKNLARAAASPRCNFYLAEGRRCASPALRNGRLCRIHVRKLMEAYARPRRIAVPNVAAARTLQVGINQVMRYLWEQRPSVDQCGNIFYGIQQAQRKFAQTQTGLKFRSSHKGDSHMMKPKNTICLWFDKDAEQAARFYAATFPDSKVIAVHKAPSDYPGGKAGEVLTVEFTVLGIPCLGLNGGPTFQHTEAFSFQVATDDQAETDRYWNAIVNNGGQESQCGWCKDRWGLSWQITPRVLMEAMAAGGDEAKRAFEAMMPMKKIDVAKIEAARRGERAA